MDWIVWAAHVVAIGTFSYVIADFAAFRATRKAQRDFLKMLGEAAEKYAKAEGTGR